MNKKVAIIGAGVIGLYLAWKLSQRDYEVEVFEAKEEIGKQSCSGLISDRILDFVPRAESFAENKIDQAEIRFPRRTVTLSFSNDFLAIDRPRLDKELAESARQSGAKIELDSFMGKIPRGFDYVLGCDGAQSKVRSELGLKEMSYRLGIRGFVKDRSSQNLVKTWPVERGFVWRIPRGERTEYGIVGPREKANGLLNNFLAERELELKRISADLIGQGINLSSDDSVVLCGEAAGLTKGWSGGGVIWGLQAADCLLENFPDLDSYRSQLKRFFNSKIFVTNLATKFVYKAGFNFPYILPKQVKVDSDFLIP